MPSPPPGRKPRSRPRGGQRRGRRREKRDRQPRGPEPLALEEIRGRLEAVLGHATADETEIVWLEALRGSASGRSSKVETRTALDRTVTVRVIDRGRVGSFRTGAGDVGEIADGVRAATAQSRAREPLAGLHHLPADETEIDEAIAIHDPAIASLHPRRVQDVLRPLLGRRESLEFHWSDARVAVFNSRNVRRSAQVTAAELVFRCARRPGGGSARAAARRLEDVDPRALAELARERHGSGEVTSAPAEPVPLVLSPEATGRLMEWLNREAFSAKAYYDGTSFLREHLGVQVFDRSLTLRDDALDPAGLPFPFDLEGTAKRQVHLILKGAPKTPTLDHRQAAVLGLPGTAHAIGGNDARAGNLFLAPGELTDEEVLGAADGGLWIGELDRVEGTEPKRAGFRAQARGVRRIEDGVLGGPVEDLSWQDSLLRALSNVAGLGSHAVRSLGPDGFLGGIATPALALGAVEGLSPAGRD